MRNRRREHGQAQLPICEADCKRRNLRAGLRQFPEFRHCEMGFGLSNNGIFVRGGRRMRGWKMIPIADARLGKLVKIGEKVLLPSTAVVSTVNPSAGWQQRFHMPIRGFPRLTYGLKFPVRLRAAIYPS
jgi:hypothetical protein